MEKYTIQWKDYYHISAYHKFKAMWARAEMKDWEDLYWGLNSDYLWPHGLLGLFVFLFILSVFSNISTVNM